ncbi:MAG: hypothetical protein KF773_39570 [Deltaproteobacteria bacterium]|nr:hypothetical protein [Deltaproteobacteria bacterium]MCW5805021.1 hypothetical protein [Deltaproteobacteria bacterium]
MAQPGPDVASSSVPDLRPPRIIGKIVIGVGAVVVVAALVLGIMVWKSGDNPGKAACEHLEQLASENPQRWDKWVRALGNTVVTRAYVAKEKKIVKIEGETRYDRCVDAFKIIRDLLTYNQYTTLSECVEKATTWKQGADCFKDFF